MRAAERLESAPAANAATVPQVGRRVGRSSLDVAFGDESVGACAYDIPEVDTQFVGDATSARRRRDARRNGPHLPRLGCWFGGRFVARFELTFSEDIGQDRADRIDLAFVGPQLADDSGDGALDLYLRLVGLDGGHDVTLNDSIARRPKPRNERCFLRRLTDTRNPDGGGHQRINSRIVVDDVGGRRCQGVYEMLGHRHRCIRDGKSA